MAKKDPSWQLLREDIGEWMRKRGMTARELCDRINADPELEGWEFTAATVAKWRLTTTPPLKALGPIGRTLNVNDSPDDDRYDPTYFARLLGLLPEPPGTDELVKAAFRLERLTSKLQTALVEAARRGRADGAGRLVSAALATHQWGAAVWPGFEGPEGYPMRVADRIDLRRRDGAAATREAVWAEPALNAAIKETNAVNSLMGPRWSPEDDGTVSRWSIAHVGSPMGAPLNYEHPYVASIAVTASAKEAWPEDVAWILAMILGYGYTSVRDLAREIYNAPHPVDRLRSEVHRSFLYSAQPKRRTWAHWGRNLHGTEARSPFIDLLERCDPSVLHVRLCESDALLREEVLSMNRSDEDDVTFEQLVARVVSSETLSGLKSWPYG